MFFASSSARATHGFNSGKIAFSVKWAGNMEVKLEEVKELLKTTYGDPCPDKDANTPLMQAGKFFLFSSSDPDTDISYI